MTFSKDSTSLKIEDCDADINDSTDQVYKKRRRKRRRRKRHLKLSTIPVVLHNQVKVTDDDLPKRARWTIVATACLLLLMCLLLVGITLRMAPIIDDMGA